MGRRSFVAGRVEALPFSGIRRMFDLAARCRDVISLGIGEPDFTTPEHIVDAAKAAADAGMTHYTANAGDRELREAIAAKLEVENGVRVDPDTEIIVTVGATAALHTAMLAVVNPGEEVIVPEPAWPNYATEVVLAGGVPVPVKAREENGFAVDPGEVAALVSSRTRAVVVNSPANPTGAVMGREDLHRMAEIALRHDLVVFSDEVYEKLVYDGAEHFSLGSIDDVRNRVITVNSFSKAYAMCGWRVGYAAGNKDVIYNMVKIQESITACACAVAQRAALAALRGPQEPLRRMVDEYARRREYVLGRLEGMPGVSVQRPRGAFYVFPNVRGTGLSSVELATGLLTRTGVVVVPGSAFGASGEGYVRLSYATSMAGLVEALDRLENHLGEVSLRPSGKALAREGGV